MEITLKPDRVCNGQRCLGLQKGYLNPVKRNTVCRDRSPVKADDAFVLIPTGFKPNLLPTAWFRLR